MGSVPISLPEDDIRWAESRVVDGEYASTEAYFAALVTRDRERTAAIARLQALVDEGRASPPVEGDAFAAIDAMMAKNRAVHG